MADYVMVKDTSTGQVKVVLGGITSGMIADGAVESTKLADGAVISAKIAAGAIGSGHIAAEQLVSAHYAPGSIGGGRIADGGLLSAHYGQTIASGHILSGQIGGDHVGAGALISANYAAGSIGGSHIANEGIVSAHLGAVIASGHILSGQIGANHLASGISVSASQYDLDTTWRAGAPISAHVGVSLLSGVDGWLMQANAFDPTLMPIVGAVNEVYASGDLVNMYVQGRCQWDESVTNDKAGAPVFVASGGVLTLTPPTASGITQQIAGTVMGSGFIMVNPDPTTVFIGA